MSQVLENTAIHASAGSSEETVPSAAEQLQRYTWDGQDQVYIFLYSSSSVLNPLLTPHHQVDSEIIGLKLAQKEVHRALLDLGQFLGPKLRKPCLISDSKTALCLMTKPAVTLVLRTGLLAAKIQDTF